MIYLNNNKVKIAFTPKSGHEEIINVSLFEEALDDVHNVITSIKENIPVDIFSILGMRNLSAFIGELFVISFAKKSNGRFIKNPHQDGYPDLLLMDMDGLNLYQKFENEGKLRDKSPFSPFENGGIEVKATCGSVPTPDKCRKLGIEKPDMNDTRIKIMCGYDWKAHHRETNNLIGILWNFIDETPHIVAIFFGNNLTEDDWGKIVQPKEGGGRTTSVSIMTRSGVNKMYQKWIIVKKDQYYVNFINKYNKGDLIKL